MYNTVAHPLGELTQRIKSLFIDTYLYYYPSTSCFLCSFFKLHNCNALIRRGLRKVWSIEFFVICHLKLFRISIFVFRIWLRPKAALGSSVSKTEALMFFRLALKPVRLKESL